MSAISPTSNFFDTTPTVAGAASTAAANTTPTETDFLRLLVAQLKHQDPSAPKDPSQFVTELAQFSQVEQTVRIATNTSTMTQQLAYLNANTPVINSSNTPGTKTGN